MKCTLLFLAAALSTLSLHADERVVMTGTFGSDAVTSLTSAPNGSFRWSFTVPDNQEFDTHTTNNRFMNFYHDSYTLNGVTIETPGGGYQSWAYQIFADPAITLRFWGGAGPRLTLGSVGADGFTKRASFTPGNYDLNAQGNAISGYAATGSASTGIASMTLGSVHGVHLTVTPVRHSSRPDVED